MVNFFEFIAEEVREYLAALGFRTLDEAIGRVDLLDAEQAIGHWKAAGLDISPILHRPELPDGAARHNTTSQDHGIDRALDNTLIQLAEGALADGTPVTLDLPVRNVNRTVGTMLGYEVTRRWGGAGLPDDTIHVRFRGSAGPVLRRLPAPRHHPAAGRRRQRLPGQGPVRRPDHRGAGPGGRRSTPRSRSSRAT